MSELAKKFADEAALLPREDRIGLIEELLQSLNTPSLADIDKLWAEEVEKRITEYDEGKIESLEGWQVFKELRERFNH
jgi:putative addiction module component (TIGR02574 family)